jgi:hypothetical protein
LSHCIFLILTKLVNPEIPNRAVPNQTETTASGR